MTTQTQNKSNSQVLVQEPFVVYLMSPEALMEKMISPAPSRGGLERFEWKLKYPSISIYGGETFEGFDLFTPGHLFNFYNSSYSFLVAYKEDVRNPENFVGILHLIEKEGYTDFREKLATPSYHAVGFVDVRRDARKQGVCKALFLALDKLLTQEDFVCGTPLEQLGKEAKLDKKIPTWLTTPSYFDNKDAFYKYCKLNGMLKGCGK
jgi:hypothetical protein